MSGTAVPKLATINMIGGVTSEMSKCGEPNQSKTIGYVIIYRLRSI